MILAMRSYFLSVVLVLSSALLFSFTGGEKEEVREEARIEWLTIEEVENLIRSLRHTIATWKVKNL